MNRKEKYIAPDILETGVSTGAGIAVTSVYSDENAILPLGEAMDWEW